MDLIHLGFREDVTADGETQNDDIIVINSNIDDSSGEDLGYVLEKLMDAGALDASYSPIFMEKNRPAYRLGSCVGPKPERNSAKSSLMKQLQSVLDIM